MIRLENLIFTIILTAVVIFAGEAKVAASSVKLTDQDIAKSNINLTVESEEDIYGIQFEFEGVTLDKSQGGYLELEGFNTSHNDNMVLAFSFEGKAIQKGEYMLLSLDVSYHSGKQGAFISDLVLAGMGGSALDFGYYDRGQKRVILRSTH